MHVERERLGLLTQGSLLDGLEMKLDAGISPESLRAGQYVVIDGDEHVFYTMITDVRLESANPRIPARPPAEDDALLRAVLCGESTYVTVHLRPLLQLPKAGAADELDNAQVKTVPGHFRTASRAGEADVARVFGDKESADRWHVGAPLDMSTPICLDLTRFVERSNGIFGKTGTGKTFLTRLALVGLLLKCPREVVTLVFDMHNEYGNQARQEGRTVLVPGLRDLFPGRVSVFTLDAQSTKRRGGGYDEEILLSYADLEPADIYAMRGELDLSETGCDTIGLVHRQYQERWLQEVLKQDAEALAEQTGAHLASLQAVQRKLRKLERLPFLRETLPAATRPAAARIVDHLIQQRQHVVIEFGNVTSLTGYLLVANVLTRKLYGTWVERAEAYHGSQAPEDKPPQLVICVEEAHKFLNPEAARQTSFGQIARELRKYLVSLLIVDQRPSGIDDEILSQLGTRITAQLSDDRDLQAVLAGTSNAAGLKVVLAGLDSKQQALIFGHAVPMPVVLRTRAYDDQVFAEARGARSALAADVDATMSAGPPRSAWHD